MRELGIGLIGTGFMGRAHALAFNQARAAFELPVRLTLAALADADAERAQRCADARGFAQAHGGWQAQVNDPGVDVVAITPPTICTTPQPWRQSPRARRCTARSPWRSASSRQTPCAVRRMRPAW